MGAANISKSFFKISSTKLLLIIIVAKIKMKGCVKTDDYEKDILKSEAKIATRSTQKYTCSTKKKNSIVGHCLPNSRKVSADKV